MMPVLSYAPNHIPLKYKCLDYCCVQFNLVNCDLLKREEVIFTSMLLDGGLTYITIKGIDLSRFRYFIFIIVMFSKMGRFQ